VKGSAAALARKKVFELISLPSDIRVMPRRPRRHLARTFAGRSNRPVSVRREKPAAKKRLAPLRLLDEKIEDDRESGR